MLLADEIGGGTVYDALHKRIAANNLSGLRVGDYLNVPLVSASSVVADQQTVRSVMAHIDPYLWCGDKSKGHHIAFVTSEPIKVSSSYKGVTNSSFIPWNKTNTNQGTADVKNPYLCSQLKGWERAFEACLPEGLTKYLLTQRVLLEERYSASGALTDSNNWSWQDIGTCGRWNRLQNARNRLATAFGSSRHRRPDLRAPRMARRRSSAKRGSFSLRSDSLVLHPVSMTSPPTT